MEIDFEEMTVRLYSDKKHRQCLSYTRNTIDNLVVVIEITMNNKYSSGQTDCI